MLGGEKNSVGKALVLFLGQRQPSLGGEGWGSLGMKMCKLRLAIPSLEASIAKSLKKLRQLQEDFDQGVRRFDHTIRVSRIRIPAAEKVSVREEEFALVG